MPRSALLTLFFPNFRFLLLVIYSPQLLVLLLLGFSRQFKTFVFSNVAYIIYMEGWIPQPNNPMWMVRQDYNDSLLGHLLRMLCIKNFSLLWKLFAFYSIPVPVQRNQSLNLERCLLSYTNNLAWRVSSGQLDVGGVIDDEACELVSGVEVSIGEGPDSIDAYLFKAVKNNNETGILLLSDIFGFEDSATREFAYRVTCNGYNVLLPDLFRGDPWTKDRPMDVFKEWLSGQERSRVAKDISTSTKWMVDEFLAAGISRKLGIIGFCFGGGRLIDVLAQDQGTYFGTAVSFYGTGMDLSIAANVKVPVLFISGDDDPLCPVSVLNNIESIIGKDSKTVIFKGRGHGFVHRPESSEEDEDAEKAFMLLRNWLHDRLVVNI